MRRKRISHILLIIALFYSCGCTDNKAFVINKNGATLQKSLTENPQRMFKLLCDTNVIVIEKSKKVFFEGKYNYSTKIKFGEFEGWVLDNDISSPIPQNKICEFSYVTNGSDYLITYINFFKNKRFDFYVDFIEDLKSGVYIVSGNWSSKDNLIMLTFDQDQPFCKGCKARDFFMKDKETLWDENITIINDQTVSFKKDIDKLVLYGNSCEKY